MATVSISHVTGAAPATFDFSSSVGEVVTVTITLLNANGSVRDCSGGTLQWEFEPRGAQGAPNYFEARGSDTGIHTIEVPFAVARLLGGNYQHDCWYRPASGEREQVCAMSTWNVVRSVGPLFCEPLNVVNEPPVVTLSAPTAAVMQAGSCAIAFGATDDLALTAANFAVVVDAVETADTITLATGSGTTSVTGTASTTLAAGAHTVGIVCEDAGGETDTATASLTAYSITITSPTAGTYDEGTQAVTVTVSPAVAAGTVLTIYDGASLVATGTTGAGATTSSLTHGSHSLTARVTISGVTITSAAVALDVHALPVVTLTSPTVAVVQGGTVALTFDATDADGVLTSANFAALVDGATTADTVTLSSGSGTGSVSGSVSVSLGARTNPYVVGVRCTDSDGEVGQDTTSLTAYSVAITTPAAGTYDEVALPVAVTVTPTVTGSTALVVRDGVTQTGATGTVGGGATTAQLAAGSHSLTASITVDGVAITSPAVSVVTADQDPGIAIASPATGAQLGAGAATVAIDVTHASAIPSALTVQVSINGTDWTAATYSGAGVRWNATVTLTADPTTIQARAYDQTSGGTVVNATPVMVNAALTFTVTGASWAGIFETANGAELTFTCTETAEAVTDLTPSFTFAGAATRHIVMTSSTTLADVRTVVVGHLDTFDQHSTYHIGSAYNLAQQSVTAVANMGLLTGLQIFACYGNPITSVDLSSCTALRYVEAGLCTSLASLTLPASSSFIRCCFEQSALTAIDLEPVAPYIYDLRAAAQQGGALAVSHGGVVFARLDHWCTRDETVTFDQAMNWSTQLPVVREIWCWNCGLSGSFNLVSSALASVQAYNNNFTSADFTNQFPTGRTCELLFADNELTGGVTLTGCNGLASIDLQDCGLSRAQVDAVLTAANGWGTSNGTLTIDGSNLAPTATGAAAIVSLTSRSWTVAANSAAGGIDVDEFTAALGAGWASLLNSAVGAWSATNSGCMVRTESTGYAIFGNPGDVVTQVADYEVQTEVTAGTKAAGFFGLVGRWTGGDGVRLLFLTVGDPTVGRASGYDTGNISLTTDAALPASWTNTGIASTLRMRMVGTTISIYCDGVLVRHGTLSTNATATGTYYGNCGEGGSTHVYNRMAVVAV